MFEVTYAPKVVQRRRDKHGHDSIVSLRRRLRNVRRELLKQAAYREPAIKQAFQRGFRKGVAAGDLKTKRIEDTLSLMAQQQAWYRDRLKYIADLVRSEDWRRRATGQLDTYLDSVAWLAEDGTKQPMLPPAAPSTSDQGAEG